MEHMQYTVNLEIPKCKKKPLKYKSSVSGYFYCK